MHMRTAPGHSDVINVHELREIVKGLKIIKAVGNDGIPSEKKGKDDVIYGQELPSGEFTTTECGVNYQQLAVIY